jgi:hypothetical protein
MEDTLICTDKNKHTGFKMTPTLAHNESKKTRLNERDNDMCPNSIVYHMHGKKMENLNHEYVAANESLIRAIKNTLREKRIIRAALESAFNN